jgi:hypothetical protein
MITMTKNGDFYANFLGLDQGGGVYDLYFAAAFDPGGSSYDTGTIVDDGDDVIFTSAITSTDPLATFTPYYAMMEAAWMYDLEDNYSQMMSDDGLILTNPDYYAIPEPAVIVLLMGSGGMLIGINRARGFLLIHKCSTLFRRVSGVTNCNSPLADSTAT